MTTSRSHQLILGLIVRKMREKGYLVVSFEGNESLIGDLSLDAPKKINRHKPDLIGINLEDKRICIGEAKTSSDLSSKRTKEQFLDFSCLMTKSQKLCELIIGIPRSSEKRLLDLLQNLKISNRSNISYIWMPDDLLLEEENGI
ncbi:hypothetical protein J4404_03840 [Candidatus Woesearchaeota archaeon]|nr:hypothetical protein [Candidatus Woesearchaeota archaeon]